MKTQISLALAALFLSSHLAFAGPAPFTNAAPSVVVHFGDLDLSTPQGVRTLHKRLWRAAYLVCRDLIPRPSIESAQCQDQLIEAALQDVNAKLRLAGRTTQVFFR